MSSRISAAVAPDSQSEGSLQFLAGGGELGALMRAHDWASTSLGAPGDWPRSLKTAVRIMLTSRQPIWIGWGPELVYLYNDPYKSIIGGKHPHALGRPTKEVWREIWHDIGPMLATAMRGDEGTYVEEQLLIMERSGYPEETYYTFSYSPIPDDDGSPGGIICANTDDTKRVIGERQLALLRELATATIDARTVESACGRSAKALATNQKDVPFALVYLGEPDGRSLSLECSCGLNEGHVAAPRSVVIDDSSTWPLGGVTRGQKLVTVSNLAGHFGAEFPKGAWDKAPTHAAVVPIPTTSARPAVLVCGLNPYRLFDDDYRRFVELAAGEIGSSITNAQAYEEERQRVEALAEIDRAKTAFFSNISHEFRTPLALMLGPVEDALNDTSSALETKQRERLELAHRNSLRLLKLVNTLLDFSRIEAARIQAHFRATDLAMFTAELASSFRAATDRAGLKLVIGCSPFDEPAFVDHDMWEKIVLNLISNAFKFTFEGEIAVDVRKSTDGSAAELSVRDTGTGIPREELPRLFERFHRIEGAKGRTFEGSGIGLALVAELVKQHGGSIRVESEEGRGTTFTVSVPFGNAHLPEDRVLPELPHTSSGSRAEAYVQEALRWLPESTRRSSEPAGASASDDLGEDAGAARGAGERVLLADDNADVREYIRRLLVERGYFVEAVGDGEAALAAAHREAPDLVLSDVMMPRLDGLGLLSRLRAEPALRSLPVILLSARAGEEARIEGLDAGADDYISKPFSARELLARVRANLQLAKMRREAEEIQRDYAARLEAVVDTVPTAMWFTYDPDARTIFGNAYGESLLHVSPDANPSMAAPAHGRPEHRVFSNGEELTSPELPLQRAARGESVRDEELEVRTESGSSRVLLFSAAPIRDRTGAIKGAVCGAIDITDRKRQEQHQKMLVDELNHRVKNTLATVQSFAMQTLRNASTVAEGRAAFDSRLIALSKAHDILVRERWEGAGLREVVTEALAAYSDGGTRLTLGGPEIRVQTKTALALAMALHELATNAVKYGALSTPSGIIEVKWSIDRTNQQFELRWSESGGPPVVVPGKRGFGSRLIEQGLSQDLAGEVRLEFESDGVVCTICAPLNEVCTQSPHNGKTASVQEV